MTASDPRMKPPAVDPPTREPESPGPDGPFTHAATVEEAQAGMRLDRWMAGMWMDLSRSRCKALVEAGHVRVDDAPAGDPAAKVRAGQHVALNLPPPRAATPQPEAIALDVLFEDPHLIVLNKPAGIAVHPAAGHWTGTLVHALLHHCAGQLSGIGGVERPGIVHRLDKDTSGVLVAAKTDAAHQGLSALFAAHDMERAYLACTRGAPKPRSGRLETRLARSDGDRRKQAVIPLSLENKGKIAVTHYATQDTFGQEPGQAVGAPQAALVECRLETGRTHQIRVHMAHLGAPLLGDPLYGKGGRTLAQRVERKAPQGAAGRTDQADADADDAPASQGRVLREFRRQALHAAILGFRHPITGEALRFETPPPKDMQRLIAFLRLL